MLSVYVQYLSSVHKDTFFGVAVLYLFALHLERLFFLFVSDS